MTRQGLLLDLVGRRAMATAAVPPLALTAVALLTGGPPEIPGNHNAIVIGVIIALSGAVAEAHSCDYPAPWCERLQALGMSRLALLSLASMAAIPTALSCALCFALILDGDSARVGLAACAILASIPLLSPAMMEGARLIGRSAIRLQGGRGLGARLACPRGREGALAFLLLRCAPPTSLLGGSLAVSAIGAAMLLAGAGVPTTLMASGPLELAATATVLIRSQTGPAWTRIVAAHGVARSELIRATAAISSAALGASVAIMLTGAALLRSGVRAGAGDGAPSGSGAVMLSIAALLYLLVIAVALAAGLTVLAERISLSPVKETLVVILAIFPGLPLVGLLLLALPRRLPRA